MPLLVDQRSPKVFTKPVGSFVWPRNISDFIYHIDLNLQYYRFQITKTSEALFHVLHMVEHYWKSMASW